jgi:hypothetical protein
MDRTAAERPKRGARASQKQARGTDLTPEIHVELDATAKATIEPPPVTAHAVLDALIKRYSGTKTLTIDGPAARRLLATNTGNRHVSARRVSSLAQQMRDGHWENTGEPIIVSDEGILNNGQHRLLAVIEADASVEMDVRFGIPRKAFVKTDTGAARSPADILSIRGVTGAAAVAMTLRLLLLYERGLPEHVRDSLTNDEVNRAFDRWPDVIEAYTKVQVFRFPSQIRSTPLYATAFLATRVPRAPRVDSWLHTLATGEEARRDDPAYVLRERLIRTPFTELGTRERQMTRFALMIKSWNSYCQGETVQLRDFRWIGTGRGAEPFPSVAGSRLSVRPQVGV